MICTTWLPVSARKITTLSIWTAVLVVQFLIRPTTSNAQAPGYLRVASSPPGATISIDGAVVGTTGPDAESSHVISSTVGTHNLRVFLVDVGEDEFSVTLFPSDTLEIFVELGSGEQLLTLTSSPSGAEVTINGVAMGQTPIEGFKIMGADYQVSLRRACYLPYDSEVSMDGRPQLNLHVELQQSVVIPEPHPNELVDISLCQTGREIVAQYTLVPGPTGNGHTKWQVDAVLENEDGLISAGLNGDINRTMSVGPKKFDIQLPEDVSLNDRFELHFSTTPRGDGSSSKLLLFAGAAIAVAGGAAAAVLLGGGNGSTSGTQVPLPPGRPE